MKFANKLLVLLLALILTFPMAVMAEEASSAAPEAPAAPAAPAEINVQTFETQDGVLSIAAPADNDKWTVLPDDQRWFTMSDGTDTITVDHYANGDTLPAATVAKAPIVQVYQVFYSTANEVFVVTGEVTVAEDMPFVRDAVNSFKVLQYDTKKPAEPQPEASYGIRDINSDMYCITPDGVNVRASYSTSSEIIGGVSYKEKVFVIGEVTKDGADTGWLKIQHGNGEGYVFDEWFDVNEPTDPVRTGDQMTVFNYDGSQSRILYFYTDGIWRDDNGNTYQTGMSAEVQCSDGTVWYEEPVEPYRTGAELTLYREDGGSTKQIYYYSDNCWRDDRGVIYYSYAEHLWQSEQIDQYNWFDDPSYIPDPDPYPTGDELTLYRDDGEATKQIYYYSDDQWRDDNYVIYITIGEHEWTSEGYGQHSWFDDPNYLPGDDPYPTGDYMTLYRADGGNTIEIYYYDDGQWRDNNMNIWFPVDDHEWDMEGTSQYVWYDDPGYINY